MFFMFCEGETNSPFSNSLLFNKIDEYDDDYYSKISTNNILPEITKISENKIKYFKITKEIRKKLGRKRKNTNQKKNEKCHSKYVDDNVVRTIQVAFQKFLVSFINEILRYFGIKKKFLDIAYKFRKDIKKENVENLKSIEIGQILRQNLTTKYRKQYHIISLKKIIIIKNI